MTPEFVGQVPHGMEGLRLHGILWAINRHVFHPRGFALALKYPPGTPIEDIEAHRVQPIGIEFLGDGNESWSYSEELEDEGYRNFRHLLDLLDAGGCLDCGEDPDYTVSIGGGAAGPCQTCGGARERQEALLTSIIGFRSDHDDS